MFAAGQAEGSCLEEKSLLGFCWLLVSRSGDAQEDQNSTVQPYHILVGKAADTRPDLGLREQIKNTDDTHPASTVSVCALASHKRQPQKGEGE